MLDEIRTSVTQYPGLVVTLKFDENGVDLDIHEEGSYVGDGQIIPWEQMPTYGDMDTSLNEVVTMAVYRYLHDSGSLKRGDIYGK